MAIILPKGVAENIDQFTGRTWLLPRILDWWDHSDERLLLLTGGPGTGKSMILAWLSDFGPLPQDATAQAQLTRVRSLVKATHFCQASSRNISPQAFAENIANQLTGSVKGFAESLAATLAERVQITVTQTIRGSVDTGGAVTGVSIGRIDLGTLGDELSFDRAFTQPLKKLIDSGYTQPILVLLDALDEALTYTGVTLPDLLSRLTDLPTGVRILATTRDEPRVLKFFRDIQPFDLISDAPPDVDDVRVYATQRLTSLNAIQEARRSEFADRLSMQAGSVFLYAAMVLDELLERPSTELPDLATYPLPEGLSGLYRDFLNRELGKDEQLWSDRYRPLLGVIAVAQGDGLTAPQLGSIIKRDLDEVGDILRRCKQYLSGDLPGGPFRPFHKSFADFLLEDKDNLDYHVDAAAMHQRIVEHYWSNHHDDWSKCDDYGIANLAAHLHHAQQFDRLAELMSQEWMHARVAREGYRYDGFVADLSLAWRHAYKDALAQIAADDKEFAALAYCFRYALIRTSINSISANYPPALVKRALETGVWTFAKALDVSAHVPDDVQKAETYLALLELGKDGMTEAQRDEVLRGGLAAARAIEDEPDRVQGLAALAPHLSGAQLGEALAAARAIEYKPDRVRVLAALAPQLTGETRAEVLGEALAAARTIEDERFRALVLGELAPYLSGETRTEVLGEALAAARAIDPIWDRGMALKALAPQLTGETKAEMRDEVLDEALAAALTIENVGVGVQVLEALAPYLSGTQLGEALAAALRIEDVFCRAYVLEALAPYLSGTQLGDALAADLTIEPIWDRGMALKALAPYLSGAQLGEALAAARAMEYLPDRVQVLAALAPQLTGETKAEVLGEALAATRESKDYRARVIPALAPQLSDEVKSEVLGEALAAARAIEYEPDRGKALAALAPYLNGAQLGEALAAARAIEYEPDRGKALAALAPYLNGAQLGEALAAGVAMHEEDRAQVLAALAPYLSGAQLGEALAAGREIEDRVDRSQPMAILVPQLSGSARTEVLSEALAAARASKDHRARVLIALAPQLSDEVKNDVLGEALAAARAIEYRPDRVRVLAALAPQLTGEVKGEVLGEALAAARTIEGKPERARALAALAPQLNGEVKSGVLGEALVAARENEKYRAWALAALAPQLNDDVKSEVVGEALAAARTIEDERFRALVLGELAPYLSGAQLSEVLAAARAMKWEGDRARVLTALAPQLNDEVKSEALAAARAIKSEEYRAQALIALPCDTDGNVRVREIRCCLVDYLEKQLSRGKCVEVIDTLFGGDLVRIPLVSSETAAAFARYLTEICHRWSWL